MTLAIQRTRAFLCRRDRQQLHEVSILPLLLRFPTTRIVGCLFERSRRCAARTAHVGFLACEPGRLTLSATQSAVTIDVQANRGLHHPPGSVEAG
jgi:hypothetical protein